MSQTNEKKGFLLYFDSYDTLSLLDDAQRGRLLLALLRYAMAIREEVELTPIEALKSCPELDPQAAVAFSFLADTVRRDTKEWLKHRNNYQRAARERSAARQSVSAPAEPPGSAANGQPGLDDAWKYVSDGEK